MNRSSLSIAAIATLTLSMGALSAQGTDADSDVASQTFNDAASGYGVDATDRGGRPQGDRDRADASELSIMDWLLGLMD
ncbi:MAG: hypothetical protein AB8G16_14315 [Gammaproteobacteria bacterium]